jgi:hypothetical protein
MNLRGNRGPHLPVGDAHYMAVSWRSGCGLLVRGRGVNSMTIALLIAGIGLLLAGLLTVGYGILLDLSLGNTLIYAGTIIACTGVMVLAVWIAIRELKKIAGQLGLGIPVTSRAGTAQADGAGATSARQAPENAGFPFGHEQPAPEHADHAPPPALPSAPAPWQDEAAARDRGRSDAPPAPEPVEAAPAVKPKRNLLFSSSSRKERERAEGRTEPAAPALRPTPAAPPPAPESNEVSPPATFDDAWPQSERSRTPDVPPPRRSVRPPSTFAEPSGAAPAPDRYPPAARNGDQPPVTVLKSGVVDGMAYSLYSDGSIEAQMPEGMMRFASIDELRSHLDQRP